MVENLGEIVLDPQKLFKSIEFITSTPPVSLKNILKRTVLMLFSIHP